MNGIASDTSEDTIDYEASADRIGSMLGEDLLGPDYKATEPPEPLAPPEKVEPVTQAPPMAEPQAVTPSAPTYDVPKSWKKEMHPHWEKVTPEAKAYIIEREKQLLDGFQTFRPIQDALTPHQDYLSRAGIAPAQAVGTLINAQRRLTEGTEEQRWGAVKELIKHLGFEQRMSQATQPPVNGEPAPQIDPALQSLSQRLEAMEQRATQEFEQKRTVIYNENLKQIEAFASDTKAHPYFDDVADEVAMLIKERGLSLQDAYPIAVRMNPTVWAKEEARLLTEHEAKLKETARLNSLSKRKATSVNIKSNGDGAEPTEPIGSLEDTIKGVSRAIRERGRA
jgi:hypothetical protein